MSNRLTARERGLDLIPLHQRREDAYGDAAFRDQIAEIGYTPLSNPYRAAKLINGLIALGITKEFAPDAVDRYKVAKVDELQSSLAHKAYKACCLLLCRGFPYIGGALGLLILLSVMKVQLFADLFIPVGVASGIIFMAATIIGCTLETNLRFHQWVRTPISKYQEPIPMPVLKTIARIKQAVPEAEFAIDRLTSHPDPLLVVSGGDRSVYLEVWDEPSFEAKPVDITC